VTFVAHFEDGDWGGREQTYDHFPGHRLAMPARIRVRAGLISESGTLPTLSFPSDEYELTRTVPLVDCVSLSYRYMRPDIERMQAEIARLKERVFELENPPRRGLVRFAR
jgi:hypothetical protein